MQVPPSITTPALAAAWRAARAFLDDPHVPGVRQDLLDPRSDCVLVRSRTRSVSIEIEAIERVAPQVPPPAAAQMLRLAASGHVVHVLQDMEGKTMVVLGGLVQVASTGTAGES